MTHVQYAKVVHEKGYWLAYRNGVLIAANPDYKHLIDVVWHNYGLSVFFSEEKNVSKN